MLTPPPTTVFQCPICGVRIHGGGGEEWHGCTEHIRDFEATFRTWLETPAGQFSVWLARTPRPDAA